MFIGSYRGVVFFFLLLIFFVALLMRPDWAQTLGPWPDRALVAIIVFTMYFVMRP